MKAAGILFDTDIPSYIPIGARYDPTCMLCVLNICGHEFKSRSRDYSTTDRQIFENVFYAFFYNEDNNSWCIYN